MDIKAEIELCGFLLAVGVAAAGVWRYWRGQVWKQLEFIAEHMRYFQSDRKAKNAMLMLDWNSREIELYPGEDMSKDRWEEVDDSMLYQALATSRQQQTLDCLGGPLAEIRDCFDAFLGYLELFNQFIESKLISPKQLWPFVGYWLNFIGDRKAWKGPNGKDEILMLQLWDFIYEYEYEGVIALCARYGIGVKLSNEEGRLLDGRLKLI